MSSEVWSELSIREALGMLVRRRYIFLGTFFLLAAMAVLLVLVRRDKFVSEAKVFVPIGRESVALDPTATTGQTLSLPSRETEINSILEMCRSRAVVEQVVDAIGTEKILATHENFEWVARAKQRVGDFKESLKHQLTAATRRHSTGRADPQMVLREEAVERLMANISVAAPKMSTVIIITSKARTPDLAQEIVDEFLRVCVNEHLRLNRIVGSQKFFEEQSELMRTQWVDKRLQLNQLKNERGFGTIESQFAMLEQQKADVELARLHNRSELAATRAKCDAVKAAISQMEPTVVLQRVSGMDDLGTEGMRQQLYELEIQERELASRYHNDHPLMVAIRRQLEEARTIHTAEQDSQTQTTFGLNPTWQQFHAEQLQAEALLASLNATGKALDAQIGTIVGEIRDLNSYGLQHETLQREIEQLAVSYATYSESLELSRIGHELEQQRISNVNVAQPATFVLRPIGPSRSVMAGLGLLIALVGGVGMAYLRDRASGPAKQPQREQAARLVTPRRRPAASPATFHDEEEMFLASADEEERELQPASEAAASPQVPR